jgi:hypothetical protein
LIGRQNSFEDLQFVDPGLYHGLVALKHSQEDISELDQTFVVMDKIGNGEIKWIDLLNPGRPPTQNQVPLTKYIIKYLAKINFNF